MQKTVFQTTIKKLSSTVDTSSTILYTKIKTFSNALLKNGTNSRLKCIIKNANGYRNFNRFRNRYFFAINKHKPILGKPKNKEKDKK